MNNPPFLRTSAKFFASIGLSAAMGCVSGLAGDKPADSSRDTVGVFAIGSSAASTKLHPQWIPKMTAIGIHDLRAPRTSWNMVQPEGPDSWNWDELDRQLSYLEGENMRTGGLFAGTAANWNKQDDPRGLPLKNLEGWSKYVFEIVKHAKGRITYWEVWNEPPNGTRNAPASDYAKIVMATYQAAKAADPDCKIGMAAKSAHINYLDQAIQAGAKDHFDYITLHPYESLGCVQQHPGTEPVYLQIVPALRRMLAARNPAKKDVPVWFTEIGFDTKRGEGLQAEALVKAYTLGIAQGVQSINWYEGMDGDSGDLGLLRKDGSERASYRAMAEMIRLFGQHPEYLGWVQFLGKHYGFVFQGPRGAVLAAWAGSAAGDTVDFGETVKIVDPQTGTATSSRTHLLTTPILVDGVPARLVAEAKANKGRPLPWGGDYSKADAVSVTMGEKNIEEGLHTMSAETVAADVVAYGGSARAGNIPGGNVFMVDPNFLLYDKAPLEITAVVRRNAANKPARLELEYESTAGYKKAAAFDIPDNTSWHTARWQIDDPQFVGMWAFNFRLNAGDYAIQKVTVKKRTP